MTERDKKIRDLVIKVRGYYDGIDERLTDALKEILRRLDEPDHIPDVGEKVEIDVVKIQGLLKKTNKDITNMADALWVEGRKRDSCILHEQRQRISKAIALLPEPCPTCGGSGKLHCKSVTPGTINCPDCTESQEPCPTCGGSKIEYLGTDNQGFVVLATTRKHYAIPCPDCQSQEPAEKPEGVVFDNKSTIKTASS